MGSLGTDREVSPEVVIVLGSESDEKWLLDSNGGKVTAVLVWCGVKWELSICSAHRNTRELTDLCFRYPAAVYVAGAGMAAQLAGVIAAHTEATTPVIGVALPSDEFPNAMDALLSMTRMPPGTPVVCAGIGKAGFINAMIFACQIIGVAREEVREGLQRFRQWTNKPPAMGKERG